MATTFDRNLFTQIGLDSASLTMLGSLVHDFGEPGQYRGALHLGREVLAVFYITVDKNSPVAQATIDLAALLPGNTTASTNKEECCCGSTTVPSPANGQFVVNPRGHTLFHVGSGAGGYYVHVRRIDAPTEDRGYDSRTMADGDLFSAMLLRPGTYSMTNSLTHAGGELRVLYPLLQDTPHRPGDPIRVECGEHSFEPPHVEVQAGQGILFEAKVPARLRIELIKPDDGPSRQNSAPKRSGWRKSSQS